MARSSSGCRGFWHSGEISRREVLRGGSLVGFGLSLPMLLEQRARGAASGGTFGRAKSIISLYLHGGHPQQETFDPKPDGPSAVRGEFKAISPSLPGVQFSEVLPKTARIAHRLAVVRSMSHGNANHVSASLPAQTGPPHPPGFSDDDFPPSASDFPPVGAVIDKLRGQDPHPNPLPKGEGADGLPKWVRIGPLMRRNNGTGLHGQLPG